MIGPPPRGPRPRGQSGYAMAITLFVLFLLAIALTLVGLSLSIRLRMVKGETEAVVRGALTDAALDEALANLAVDRNYSGVSRHALSGGEIESEVVEMGSSRYTVMATGRYAGKARAIQATVYRSPWGEVVIESWRLAASDSAGEATPR